MSFLFVDFRLNVLLIRRYFLIELILRWNICHYARMIHLKFFNWCISLYRRVYLWFATKTDDLLANTCPVIFMYIFVCTLLCYVQLDWPNAISNDRFITLNLNWQIGHMRNAHSDIQIVFINNNNERFKTALHIKSIPEWYNIV